MGRTSFAKWPCSIARTMDLIGDPWTPLILREAFYGFHRFDDFQRELGIARNTLADRLRMLVEAGLMTKQAYQSEPIRYDYILTEMGRDFFPVLATISHWGDRWLTGEAGPPTQFHHADCGPTHAEVVCARCGQQLRDSDTTWHMGPGYPPHLATRPDVVKRFAAASGDAR